ncbi:MAG: 16S rRNA (cytosine(1402)-N(4))-methyltransferase RsmH [Planctomycetes bacterium]|nr:16S rRNA (cytosine(1402)-N(4))-methyltransferase RsmH [Planctomycetota bacterium]
MESIGHLPVLAAEVLEALAPAPGETAFDGTAGRGGHAELMARRIGPSGTLVLMDLDAGNLAFAAERIRALPQPPRVIPVHGNFDRIASVLQSQGLRADVVMADLGFASTQMDDPARGFAFQTEGPLDMRLDRSQGPTAAELLGRMRESELADLIYNLGEDPFARRIARAIIDRRNEGGLRTTQDLSQAVVRAYGARARQSRVHPATRTFMALRIAVNGELNSLNNFLSDLGKAASEAASGPASWLAVGGRVAILSFHSLEDRSTKRAFADWERQGWATRITRKPMVASEMEQRDNPRSRSAKLRAARIESRKEDASAAG